MKRLILTDQSTFKDVRQQQVVYIDKTKHIYDVLQQGKSFFFARPRRFGKSLLCSTLNSLFRAERDLFKGLWIDTSDWKWQKHPVIHLNMSAPAGADATLESFRERIKDTLSNIADEYNVTTKNFEQPGGQLAELIRALHAAYGIGVAVIIDEYDKPLLDQVTAKVSYKDMHNVLSSFYAPLKYMESSLNLVFMTGVYKFAKTSVFSSLNNLIDLTFDPLAAALIGYTQEEIESNFNEEIDNLAAKSNVSRTSMLETLREQYNGYRFGVDVSTGKLSTSVYNSFAMNNVFAKNMLVERWFESGSPSFLIEKIKEGKFATIAPEGLELDFRRLDASCGPEAITAESLLYYGGYATMTEFDPEFRIVKLKYPNKEVSQWLTSHLLEVFLQPGTPSGQLILSRKMAFCFKNNDLSQLHELLNQSFARLSYEMMLPLEHYFQSLLFCFLDVGSLKTDAEVATNSGRIDVIVQTHERIFILELKFNKPAAEGLQQIKDRAYAQRYLVQGLPIIGVGISVAIDAAGKPEGVANRTVFDVAYEQLN